MKHEAATPDTQESSSLYSLGSLTQYEARSMEAVWSRTGLLGRLLMLGQYDIRHLTTSLYKYITVMSVLYHAYQSLE